MKRRLRAPSPALHTVTFVLLGASGGTCTAGTRFNLQHGGSVQVVFVKGAS